MPEIEQLELVLSTYWHELSEGIDGGHLQLQLKGNRMSADYLSLAVSDVKRLGPYVPG